jgi:glycosyltransferase involved in cell wall biosynthesis
MTHINRKRQLLNTLQSIQDQDVKDLIEVIIVDDVSETPLSYSDVQKFDLDIKLVTISTKNKWWVNPVVAFNTAFHFIHGERVIIQNAECLHGTNIVKYVIDNLKKNEYIAMLALALSKTSSEKITEKTQPDDIDTNGAIWYCHPEHRPDPLNFCAAMFTEDLVKIGGFDNRYAEGMWSDDTAFLSTLKKHGIETRIEDSQLVFHQWHEDLWHSNPNMPSLVAKNRVLVDALNKEINDGIY